MMSLRNTTMRRILQGARTLAAAAMMLAAAGVAMGGYIGTSPPEWRRSFHLKAPVPLCGDRAAGGSGAVILAHSASRDVESLTMTLLAGRNPAAEGPGGSMERESLRPADSGEGERTRGSGESRSRCGGVDRASTLMELRDALRCVERKIRLASYHLSMLEHLGGGGLSPSYTGVCRKIRLLLQRLRRRKEVLQCRLERMQNGHESRPGPQGEGKREDGTLH